MGRGGMGVKAAAVILAAGKGVRMVSGMAKVLHPVCGRPMLGYVLETVRRCGVERTLIVVGHQAEAVREAFSDEGVEFVLQQEQRGTGHAVMQTERYLKDFGGEILVLCGDTPLLKPSTVQDLLRRHREAGAAVSLLTASLPDPSGYGRVIRLGDGSVAKVVEEKDTAPAETAVKEINAGAYCFAPQFLFRALSALRDDNAQGELYLTDLVGAAVKVCEKVVAMGGEADEVLGVNSRAELARAEKVLRGEINNGWMLRGVTLVDPEATYIDYEVQIGGDTVIHPGCHIYGRTVIGEGCTVMPGAVIRESRVGRGARLGPYSVLEGTCLPEGGEVGPFEVKRGGFRP